MAAGDRKFSTQNGLILKLVPGVAFMLAMIGGLSPRSGESQGTHECYLYNYLK